MNARLHLFIFFLFLVIVPASFAVNTQDVFTLTLLSISEQDNNTLQGGTAELYLQLRPGRGAIFIESYPLSKIDTQVATRLANEIACSFSTADCSAYDFFYTIRADAPLVGGPSAGGATAVLTLAALENKKILPGAAMTGAISSGGIITPVGGVKEKLEAAALAQKTLVVAPALSFIPTNQTNTSISVDDFAHLSLTIFPVLTLEDAFLALTSQEKKFPSTQLIVDKHYVRQMAVTSEILCNRSSTLLAQVLLNQTTTSTYTFAIGFLNQSTIALTQEDYYARASFCYSANIHLRELLVAQVTNDVKLDNKKRLTQSITNLDEAIDAYPLATFSDLETYFIVKERVLEAQLYLDEINDSAIDSRLLALAIERYYSGVAWSEFFGLESIPLVIDDASLRIAALQEFEKVESRLNYLQLYLPDFFLVGIQDELLLGKKYFQEEQYALALFKATTATAKANSYLTTFTLTQEQSPQLVLAKLERAKNIIARQKTFPILGYSYYEYAGQLIDSDIATALLYSEYALAFSNLDAYFVPDKRFVLLPSLTSLHYFLFLTGFFLGLVLMFALRKVANRSLVNRTKLFRQKKKR